MIVVVAGCTQPAPSIGSVARALGGAPPPGTTSLWSPASCQGNVFSGCSQQGQPVCTDFGGPYDTNWNNAAYQTCQTACQAPGGPNSYCAWQGPSCSGGVFSGCAQPGQPTCSDFGGSGYPNWTSALWDQCNKACSLGSRNDWCEWVPPTHTGWSWSGAGEQLVGCAQPYQSPCTDFGNPSYPNWTSALGKQCATICTSTCPAADPTDWQPDDAALQACLDRGGTIKLSPGWPGYIIASGITITQSNTTLKSTDDSFAAELIAANDLQHAVLSASNVSNLNINHIFIDGNRESRTNLTACHDYRGDESNIVLGGISGGSFKHNRSTGTLCGSSFGFHGSGFTIEYNLFDNNGAGREAIDAPEPWSDGITLGLCNGTTVENNAIIDATDVGIVDGGGQSCVIQNNYVWQISRHSFGGIQFGLFPSEGNGDHTNSIVTNNQVSGAGLQSFGLVFGAAPWNASTCLLGNCTTGGTMSNNSASGAIVDLVVDGVVGATVSGNTLGAPWGWAAPLCGGKPKYYAVGDDYSSTLSPGYTNEDYTGCIP